MSTPLPIVELMPVEKLWLEKIHAITKSGKRPNYREVTVDLMDGLPNDFHPSSISRDLVDYNGELITLLGIVAVEKNYAIIEKTNAVIKAGQQILKKDPNIEKIEAKEIASMTGLSIDEIKRIIHHWFHYDWFSSSAGSYTNSSFGFEYFSVDDASFYRLIRIKDINDVITQSIEINRKQALSNDDDEDETDKKATLHRQVLAIHFLLKEAGINPVDKPAGVAKFIQFLNGRKSKAPRIQDTTVYKNVKSPYNIKEELALKDLHAIRPFFEEMELHAIVAKIDKDIRHSQQSG